MFQLLKFLDYLHKKNKVLLSLSSRKIYVTGSPDNPIIKFLEFDDITEIG